MWSVTHADCVGLQSSLLKLDGLGASPGPDDEIRIEIREYAHGAQRGVDAALGGDMHGCIILRGQELAQLLSNHEQTDHALQARWKANSNKSADADSTPLFFQLQQADSQRVEGVTASVTGCLRVAFFAHDPHVDLSDPEAAIPVLMTGSSVWLRMLVRHVACPPPARPPPCPTFEIRAHGPQLKSRVSPQIRCQSVYRGNKARNHMQAVRAAHRFNAATKIQAHYRGRIERKRHAQRRAAAADRREREQREREQQLREHLGDDYAPPADHSQDQADAARIDDPFETSTRRKFARARRDDELAKRFGTPSAAELADKRAQRKKRPERKRVQLLGPGPARTPEQTAFATFDGNDDGKLSAPELKIMLRGMGFVVDDSYLEKVRHGLNADRATVGRPNGSAREMC